MATAAKAICNVTVVVVAVRVRGIGGKPRCC